MRNHAIVFLGGLALLSAVAALPAQTPPAEKHVPTFTRDIAPILYANCVECHRAGEIAPMSLITYPEARPWAQAIARQTANGVMPPWHADAPHGTFRNERSLTQEQKDLIARWASAGAPEGDPSDLPAAPTFAAGWRIGQPDAVFEMQEDYGVPAKGTIEYENFYIPTNFTGEKWLKAVEARPGNRALVHHVLVYYEVPPGGDPAPAVLLPNRHGRRASGRRADPASRAACSRPMLPAPTRRYSRPAPRFDWRPVAFCTCRCTTPPMAPRALIVQGSG
jgi:mono/diheme cytochrome c family protein